MPDRIEPLGDSLVQHGPDSDRVYLMKLAAADMPGLPDRLEALAAGAGYGKIFAKIPARHAAAFAARGYRAEAVVPGYFGGREAGLFLARYLDPGRADPGADAEEIAAILGECAARDLRPADPVDPAIERMGPDDAGAMAAVYREVFPSYPFPIHDPAYLRETMETHVDYFGVRDGGTLIALASAEKDLTARAVEMTDFATLPAARGRGTARRLLARMEASVRAEGFPTAFTIARAVSRGMNFVFADAGYAFGGTLVNNTQISGRLESMNVWYKSLPPAGDAS